MTDETTSSPSAPAEVTSPQPGSGGGSAEPGGGGGSGAPGGSFFTADEARVLAQDAVTRGTMTREEANALLAEDGADPLAEPADPDAVQSSDLPAFAPDNLTPLDLGYTELPDPELHRAISTALADTGLDKAAAIALGKDADRAIGELSVMDDAARQNWAAEQQRLLKASLGPNHDAMVAQAQQKVVALAKSHPWVPELLDQTGLGDSAALIIALAGAADRKAK